MTKGVSQLILDPKKFEKTLGKMEKKLMDFEIGKMVILDLKRFKGKFDVDMGFKDAKELIEHVVKKVLLPIELSEGTENLIRNSRNGRSQTRENFTFKNFSQKDNFSKKKRFFEFWKFFEKK